MLGAGVRSDLNSWKQEFDRKIRERIEHLAADINDIKSMMQAYFPSPVATADTAISRIIALTDMVKADLSATGEFKKAALRYLNAFQIKHNIDRMLIIAKPSESAVFLAGMAVVEGIATALFFLGGGFTAGIGEALGLGLTISSVNVLLSACVGGFIFGRYWNYGIKCREADTIIKTKRWAARVCAVLTVLAILTLLISSGIVRATGETENISFSFTNLGTAASDFHSLMLWGIGLSFSIISWKKGLSAFSDPYPGLTEASRSVSYFKDETKSLHESFMSYIAELYDTANDDIAVIADDIESTRIDLLKYIQAATNQRELILSAIAQAETEFEAFRAERVSMHQMVNGELPDGHDLAGFDVTGLRAEIPSIEFDTSAFGDGFSAERIRAQNALASANKAAVIAINTAFQRTL
ncbi:MAG: hypothetical protein GQ535_02920 [Rhodobacteraceae bacterium]|nr:hypothetical protein [Paracoccaceae bacterium]